MGVNSFFTLSPPAKAGAQSRCLRFGDAALSYDPRATGPRPSPGEGVGGNGEAQCRGRGLRLVSGFAGRCLLPTLNDMLLLPTASPAKAGAQSRWPRLGNAALLRPARYWAPAFAGEGGKRSRAAQRFGKRTRRLPPAPDPERRAHAPYRFPGEGRGPVALAEVWQCCAFLRPARSWAPAFAGEARSSNREAGKGSGGTYGVAQ